MAYREVSMIEIKEVLRQWLAGIPKKRIAAQLGIDPKTVRRYVAQAEECGLHLVDGAEAPKPARPGRNGPLIYSTRLQSTGAAFAHKQKPPDYSPHSPTAKPPANGVDP